MLDRYSTWTLVESVLLLCKSLLQFLHTIRFMLTSLIVSKYIKNIKELHKMTCLIYIFLSCMGRNCLVTFSWFSLTVNSKLQYFYCTVQTLTIISQLSWNFYKCYWNSKSTVLLYYCNEKGWSLIWHCQCNPNHILEECIVHSIKLISKDFSIGCEQNLMSADVVYLPVTNLSRTGKLGWIICDCLVSHNSGPPT